MPTSRESTNVSSSQNGLSFSPGQASTQQQVDINLSNFQAVSANSQLSAVIIGSTIRGSVVNAMEVWADGTVWDTTNNRALIPVTDFDPALLHRSGGS